MENTDLNQVSRGLQDEIRILRVLNRRLAELAEDGCDDPKVLGYILDLVGKTSSRISSLLQADQKLSVENNEFALSLSQALAETVGTLSNPARRKGLKTHG